MPKTPWPHPLLRRRAEPFDPPAQTAMDGDEGEHPPSFRVRTLRMERFSTSFTVFARTDAGKAHDVNEGSHVIADLADPKAFVTSRDWATLDVRKGGVLLAVCDGMSGIEAGKVASALALHVLARTKSLASAANAGRALRAGIDQANARIHAASAGAVRPMGAGTSTMLLHGDHAYVAGIGDSRAYMLRARTLVALTGDRAEAQGRLDAGAVTREQAATSDWGAEVVQTMGIEPTAMIVMNRVPLRSGDRYLLCTEGLAGAVNDADLQRVLLASRSVRVGCDALIRLARERGATDDLSVVLGDLETTRRSLPSVQ